MKKFVVPFLFSICLHLCLLASVNFSSQQPAPKKQKIHPISIVRIPLQQLKLPPVQQKKLESVQEEEEEKKQIVDLPPDHNAKKPKDARFSSETNHETERETVSRHRQPTQNPAHEVMPGPPGELGQEGKDDKNQPIPPQPERSATESANSLPDGVGPHKKQEEIQLFPDQQTLAKIGNGSGGGAPSNDAIKDVPEGEGTFLNTSAFKHAGFFNRVKRDVSQVWNPIPELRRRDPAGNIYGLQDRRTILTVTLDAEGYIMDVVVKQSSNIDFLDEIALNAFRHCKQFPNPPKGLIVNNLIIFDFGFEVSFTNRRSFF